MGLELCTSYLPDIICLGWTSSSDPDPRTRDYNWIILFTGATICWSALNLTRHTYKLSAGFRKAVSSTGFDSLRTDAAVSEKAAVMLNVFSTAWPATVSEMLQDTDAAHSMVFRSLMVTGGLIGMQTDFSKLSPPSPDSGAALAFLIGMVHLFRRLVLAGAVGFCFAPAAGADHSVAGLRETMGDPGTGNRLQPSRRLLGLSTLAETPIKHVNSEKRAELGRTAVIGTLHVILASSMLSTLPSLELIALLHDLYSVHSTFPPLLLSLDPCVTTFYALTFLRLILCLSIFLGLHVFAYHFITGFFHLGTHTFRGFWSEYSSAYMFAQLMMLSAVNSIFSSPEIFYSHPSKFQTLAVAAAALQGWWCLSFCVPNTLLIFKNVEYTEEQLAGMFDRMKFQEAAFQTLLDLQLVFVRRVHLVLREFEEEGQGGRGGVGRGRLLWDQFRIIVKVGLGGGGGEEEEGGGEEKTEEKPTQRVKSRGKSRGRSRSRKKI
ncbi:hypothetical protein TrST_g7594 [Triparma strigata]|uniref:Uncharacterized protein n=1 Tax=Triparma strigata TaxID=1606541 RepID=A0A9W7AJL0_9STRA|nr:hypothetical protein TrST_g7594 [Triparma strigata]